MKGIYKITNLKNQKFYIGQSKDLNNREHNHFYRLGRNEHHNEVLQKSFNKHGEENFIFEVLEEIDFDNFLNEREKYWLDFHGGLNNKKIYNMKDPLTNEYSDYTKVKVSKIMLGENNPNFGNKWTDEQKEILSKKKKGKTLEERIGTEKSKLVKEKMSKSQKGRKHPEEVKEKIRQANMGEKNPAYGKGDRQMGENNPMWGKKISPEIKEKLRKINLGKIVSDETKEKMSKSQKGRKHPEEVKEKIRQANMGENNPMFGKGYKQVGENNPMFGKTQKNRRPIQQLTKEGILVKEYDFISDVINYGFFVGNVWSVCNGKSKTYRGFIWKYK